MKNLLLLNIILVMLCTSAIAGGSSDKKANWDTVTSNFQKRFRLVLDNFEKIWPQGYSNLEVQFHNGDRAWKITRERIIEYTAANIPTFANNDSGYDDASKCKKPIIQVVLTDEGLLEEAKLDELDKEAVIIIGQYVFHEAFHFYVQQKLHMKNCDLKKPNKKLSKEANVERETACGSYSRDTRYPFESEPRLYRNNIYQTLVEAFGDTVNREKHLRDAKYWFAKYKKNFCQESEGIRSTDIAEGTAQYVGDMAEIFATVGFNPEKSLLKTSILKKVKYPDLIVSASAESYRLGLIAGILLDELQIDWKMKVVGTTDAITPLDALFEGVKASDKVSQIQFEHVAQLNDYAKESDDRLRLPMKMLMSIYAGETKYKLLMLPEFPSSYSSHGSYTHSTIQKNNWNSLKLGFTKNLVVSGGNVEINEATVITLETLYDACDFSTMFIVPLTEDNRNKVKINAPVNDVKNEKGQNLICVKP